MPLAETVATAVFSKQILLPARWSDFAVASGDTTVLIVVLLTVAFYLLSCFSGELSAVHKLL